MPQTLTYEYLAAPASAEYEARLDRLYNLGKLTAIAGLKPNLKGIPDRFRQIYMWGYKEYRPVDTSDLGLFETEALVNRMAAAIAKIEGWNFGDADLTELAARNPRAAQFVEMARAALAVVQEF